MDASSITSIAEAVEHAASKRRRSRDQMVVRLQAIAVVAVGSDTRGPGGHVTRARAGAGPVLLVPLADDD